MNKARVAEAVRGIFQGEKRSEAFWLRDLNVDFLRLDRAWKG